MSEENEHLEPVREAIVQAMMQHAITADEVMEVVKDQIYWVEDILNKKSLNLDTGDVTTLREVLPRIYKQVEKDDEDF